jgi:hypothetical protein
MVAVSLQSLHDTVTKASANLFVERDFSGSDLRFYPGFGRASAGSKIEKTLS